MRGKGTKNYSPNLRMRVVEVYERGEGGYKKLSKWFDIPVSSVQSIIRVSEEP